MSRSADIRVFEVANIQSALAEARNDPNVEAAIADPVVYIFAETNDPLYSQQWNLKNIGVAGTGISAWNLIPTPINTTTGTVKVAVVDTGVDKNHPDISGKIDANSANDFVNCFKAPGNTSTDCIPNQGNDVAGHGTHIAGIIGALTNNSLGIAGTGWGVKIMSVRVLNENGEGNLSDVIRGIHWAADHGAKVINMSLGAYEYDMQPQDGIDPKELLQDAVNYAYTTRGAVIVAAAGNCGQGNSANDSDSPCVRKDGSGNVVHTIVNEKSYPAVLDNVVSVGAINQTNGKANFSEYGVDKVDVAAPGVNITSLFPTIFIPPTPGLIPYAAASGTSQATPHVSAVAALLFASKSNLANSQVVDLIQNYANTTVSGYGTNWKYGVTDACKSVYASLNNGATPDPNGVLRVCGASTGGGDDEVLATPTPFPSGNICAKRCKEFVPNYSGSKRGRGDANCSGKVTFRDFNLIKKQFGTVPPRDQKKNANIQCIRKNGGNPATYLVNLADFEAWRRNTKNFGKIGGTSADDLSDEGD
ncbi:S8 family serine peptidase [Candidatus Roizmanbacteria bacterium]|nr:S8 family serine peptidase [Candidatus Roizmanbacteria bacterium]